MQRVAIGRALINEPEIIFADEPTGNLDSVTSETIFLLLKELNLKGATIVTVTHNERLAEMSTRVVSLLDGKIVPGSRDTGQRPSGLPRPFRETPGMIKTEGLGKDHRSGKTIVKVIKDLSLNIEEGECLLIKGPSGAGKSTLLNLIGTLTRVSRGRIWIEGREISRLPDHFLTPLRREKIGFVFQQFNLLSGYSVVWNVILPLIPLGLGDKVMERRAWEILERVGLGERHDFNVNELSGGEQQRVAIARALINRPKIILADEPTSNVDRENATAVMEILGQLKKEGKTIVIASHDPLTLQEHLVDRTYLLSA